VEGLISHPREAPQLVCGEASIVSWSSGEVTIPGDEHRGLQGVREVAVTSRQVRDPGVKLRGLEGGLAAGRRGRIG